MNIIKNPLIPFLFFLCFGPVRAQHEIDLSKYKAHQLDEEILHYQIKKGKSLSGKQNIHILSIPLELLKSTYSLELAWSDSAKFTTSHFGKKSKALAAVNAGFFNVAEGGSVTYLEIENERVARRSWKGDTPANLPTNLNGALIIYNNGEIKIEQARESREYLNSHLEKWVLVTGPVLIQEGIKNQLLTGSFVDNRHPRTAVGITAKNLLLITVDGRHSKAKGMTLPELQDFMMNLGCKQAINLDGGGSTTMWAKSNEIQGVINYPSDNGKFDHEGERKVANALVIISN